MLDLGKGWKKGGFGEENFLKSYTAQFRDRKNLQLLPSEAKPECVRSFKNKTHVFSQGHDVSCIIQ